MIGRISLLFVVLPILLLNPAAAENSVITGEAEHSAEANTNTNTNTNANANANANAETETETETKIKTKISNHPQGDIPPVMIFAKGHPRRITDVASSVAIISRQEIEREQHSDIQDLVRKTPGVSVDGGGTRFNSGGFRIRGIGGNRVMTLIDDVPISDQFGVGSFADSGLDAIDPGMIERIEILRGPASALYGSQAIGGVVSIDTLSPWHLASAQQGHRQRLLSSYRADRDERRLAWHGALANQQHALLAAISVREGNEREAADLGQQAPRDRSDRERFAVLLKQISRFSDSNEVTFIFDADEQNLDSNIDTLPGTGRFANTTAMRADDDHSRQRFSIQQRLLPDDFTRISLRAYLQNSEVSQTTHELRDLATPPVLLQREFHYEDQLIGAGLDAQHERLLGGTNHLFGIGFDLQSSELKQRRDALQRNLDDDSQTNMLLGETFPLRDFPITRTIEAGFYLSDEFALPGSVLVLMPGVRYDVQRLRSRSDIILQNNNSTGTRFSDQTDDAWTGRLGIRWPISAHWSSYAQFAQGFRAPPASDVNLALNINTPTAIAISLPNPSLDAERSKSLEIGWQYHSPQRLFSLTVFDSHYDDFIQSRSLIAIDTNTNPPTRLFQSINIDRARIYGSELRWREALGGWLPALHGVTMELGAEWLRGENRSTDQPLNEITPPKAVLSFDWQSADQRWSLGTTSTLVMEQRRIDNSVANLFKSDGYGVHDLQIGYKPHRNWQLRAGLFNVFDKRYFDWANVSNRSNNDPALPLLAGSGRHLSISLQGEF